MRISKKSARRIRSGIKAARQTIDAHNAGLPHLSPTFDHELESRAYFRAIRAELHRIAKSALLQAKKLRGEA